MLLGVKRRTPSEFTSIGRTMVLFKRLNLKGRGACRHIHALILEVPRDRQPSCGVAVQNHD
jgi:hypothetical protein